jgi:hypothetical protein
MMGKKLKPFLQKIIDLNIDEWYIEPDSGSSIFDKDPNRFEIDPKEFLEYASQDFELEDNRGFINALSNVKRAIESQSDIIHFSFGIPYKKLDFPTKIENIQKMGISPSVILKQINKIRVNLEHFYKIPDRDRVEDAIQIAQLFLDVTTLSLSTFWGNFDIDNEKNEEKVKSEDVKWVRVIFNSDKKRFELTYWENGEKNSTIEISSGDDDYLKLINVSIEIAKNMHILNEKTQKRFFKRFYLNLN